MSTTPAIDAETTKPAQAPVPSPPPPEPAVAQEPPPARASVAVEEPPPPDEEEDGDFDEPSHIGRFVLFNAVPSSLVSGVVHFVGFLLLALLTIPPIEKGETLAINAAPAEEVEELAAEKIELKLDSAVSDERTEVVQQVLQNVAATAAPIVAVDVDPSPIHVDLSDFGEQTAPKSDLMATVGAAVGSGLSGRGAAERSLMVAQVGGTTESEAAVAAALKWFVEHQNADGSWSFDHRSGPCQGRCSNAGSRGDCRTGATAMALLPFLGAGQTHQQGQYKQNVERGLYFLTSQMKVRNVGGMQTGDLAQAGGNLYAHGLSAITLCEAYAMTHDRKLMGPAQLSLNYIVYAQDPVGGGWRYQPKMPGDTSVVGWQLMALKSGHMAYLAVPPATIQGAIRFLDGAQGDSGALYGYTTPPTGVSQRVLATSSVGLLCRMYLGWKHDNPNLKRGVEHISRLGPAKEDMYYNYYATQVMRQYCGEPGSDGHEMWEKWNTKIRDDLVGRQDKTGHQKGSWMMMDPHCSEAGGRVYCTSMATMILEVYYRHMPIYGKAAASEEFPL